MTKAGVILDLPLDRVKILGKWVDLNVTSVGHYYINVLPQEKIVDSRLLSHFAKES